MINMEEVSLFLFLFWKLDVSLIRGGNGIVLGESVASPEKVSHNKPLFFWPTGFFLSHAMIGF